jgi:hypothetical protein
MPSSGKVFFTVGLFAVRSSPLLNASRADAATHQTQRIPHLHKVEWDGPYNEMGPYTDMHVRRSLSRGV